MWDGFRHAVTSVSQHQCHAWLGEQNCETILPFGIVVTVAANVGSSNPRFRTSPLLGYFDGFDLNATGPVARLDA